MLSVAADIYSSPTDVLCKNFLDRKVTIFF